MQGSILAIGKYKVNTENVHEADQIVVMPLEEKKSIGINQIRDAIKFLSKRPLTSKQKVVRIKQAWKLTIEAQNALLKILEEPPTYALIILEVEAENQLLPTVISRCQRLNAKGVGESSEKYEDIKKVLTMNLEQKLKWAEETSKEDRGDIIEMLKAWAQVLRDHGDYAPIEYIIQVYQDLEKTSVNTRLALEYLLTKI